VQKIDPYIIDMGQLLDNTQQFLQSTILIICIPSKNIGNFGSLLAEIKKSTIEKVLLVSSTSIYPNNNLTISESDDMELTYSSLRRIEKLFLTCSKINTTIIRFGGLIGYTRNPAHFFSGGKVVNNPEANVNLIHRDDCIEIISQIIEQEVWGQVFNCCADTHPTRKEFYTYVSNSTGLPLPAFESTHLKSFKIISNKKVKKILNYEFLHADLMKIRF